MNIVLIFINVNAIYMFQRHQSDTVTIVSEIHSCQSVMVYSVSKESVSCFSECLFGNNVTLPIFLFLNIIFTNFRNDIFYGEVKHFKVSKDLSDNRLEGNAVNSYIIDWLKSSWTPGVLLHNKFSENIVYRALTYICIIIIF